MVLTDQEIQAAYMTADSTKLFARAIEQTVIAKLAGVSVEPLFWVYEAKTPDSYFYSYEVDRTRKDGNYRDKKCWKESPVFTELQLAAARVQDQREIKALRNLLERCRPSVVRNIADIKRFLIRKGNANPPDTEWLETTQNVLNRIDSLITGQ